MSIWDILRDPAWGAFEAIGTVTSVIVALWLGLRAVREIKRSQPDVRAELLVNENLVICKVTNHGSAISLDTKLRLRRLDIDGTNILDPERTMGYSRQFLDLQNGESKSLRLFNIKTDEIQPMQWDLDHIPDDKDFTYDFMITGTNLLAKYYRIRYTAIDQNFELMPIK